MKNKKSICIRFLISLLAIFIFIFPFFRNDSIKQNNSNQFHFSHSRTLSKSKESFDATPANSKIEKVKTLQNFLSFFWISDNLVKHNPNNIVGQLFKQINVDVDEFISKFHNFVDNKIASDAFDYIMSKYNSKPLNLTLKSDNWKDADLQEKLNFLEYFVNLLSIEIETIYNSPSSTTFAPDSLYSLEWVKKNRLLSSFSLKYTDNTSSNTSNSLTKTLKTIKFTKMAFLLKSNIKYFDVSNFSLRNNLDKTNESLLIDFFTNFDSSFYKELPYSFQIIINKNKALNDKFKTSKLFVDGDKTVSSAKSFKKNIAKNILKTISIENYDKVSGITVDGIPIKLGVIGGNIYLYMNDKNIRKKIKWRVGNYDFFTTASIKPSNAIEIYNDGTPFLYDEHTFKQKLETQMTNINFKKISLTNYKTYKNTYFYIDNRKEETILLNSTIIPNYDLSKIKFKVRGQEIYFSSLKEAIKNSNYYSSIDSVLLAKKYETLEKERKKMLASAFRKPKALSDKITINKETFFSAILNGQFLWNMENSNVDISQIHFQDSSGKLFEKLTPVNIQSEISEILSSNIETKFKFPHLNNEVSILPNQSIETAIQKYIYIDNQKILPNFIDNTLYYTNPLILRVNYEVERAPINDLNHKEKVYFTNLPAYLKSFVLFGSTSNYIDNDGYRYYKQHLSNVVGSIKDKLKRIQTFDSPNTMDETIEVSDNFNSNGDSISKKTFSSILIKGEFYWENKNVFPLSDLAYFNIPTNGNPYYITKTTFNKYANEIIGNKDNHIYSVKNNYKIDKALKKFESNIWTEIKNIINSQYKIPIKYNTKKDLLNKKIILYKISPLTNKKVRVSYWFKMFKSKLVLVDKNNNKLYDPIKFISSNSFDSKQELISETISLYTSKYINTYIYLKKHSSISQLKEEINQNQKKEVLLKDFLILNPKKLADKIKVDNITINAVHHFEKFIWSDVKKIRDVKFVSKDSKGNKEYFTQLPSEKYLNTHDVYSINSISVDDDSTTKMVTIPEKIQNKRITQIIIYSVFGLIALMILVGMIIIRFKF